MKPLLFTLFSEGDLIQNIRKKGQLDVEPITFHEFPDKESYIKINVNPANRNCWIFETLNHPNDKILPLLFLAETLHDLGAKQVGLIAPYLAYMRQDKRFHSDEGITSHYFAKLLSNYFSWLVTVDPHLHRIQSLQTIYSIPTHVMSATDNISSWIKANIKQPLLIGPDSESKQWIEKIATDANAPFVILEKIRRGDRDVEVSVPHIEKYQKYTPVLVDDIISTAKTMIAIVKQLKKLNMLSPVCIGVHGVFAENAYDDLLNCGVDKIITCNTIPHISNQIDLSKVIFDKLCLYL